MSLLELFVTGIVLLTCLYASYTDSRFKKIGNVCTYGLVLFGMVCQVLFAYLGVTTSFQVLWLVLGGLAVAFLMYYLGIWSPGDSKLFWGVCVALPPSLYYSFSYWRYPPFIVAVNTFVPYFLVMMVVILARTTWQQKRQVLKSILTPRFLLRFGLSLLSFTGISVLLDLFLPFTLDYFSAIVLFVVFYSLFDRFVEKRKQFYILLPFSLISIYFLANDLQYFLTMMITMALLFVGLRFFVASLGDYLFVHEVDIRNLEEGTVPANIIVQDKEGTYNLREISFASFISLASRPIDTRVVMDMTPEGLSGEKVAELKALAEQGYFAIFGDKVKVQESMPFAPIILIGVVVTIFSRGVFLERLVELVSR